ncbi:MAG TPA: ATP phosphoribosyltransferase regulatory subunit [Solirubrobacteraceae bacterium]|jgi:ATP phosphoribosyltransferase regulatory subunit|nr:ATP phosphoribosyltransferase regulatory subunit [Solirubrobacteraceae bacterium]
MTYPIPSGTRDVLPDEMRELRAIESAVRATFERLDYGEISTPALEYEDTLARADVGDAKPTYRLFDEQGAVLVLRSDMTVPIARVVGTRYPTAPLPLRFYYLAHAYRGVRPQRGQPREFLQAGIELVGSPSPEGTIEALNVLCAALEAVGLEGYRVGLGDASLFPTLLDELGVAGESRGRILHELYSQDFAGLEREVARLDIDADAAGLLVRVPQVRGESAVLDDFAGGVADAALASVRAVLEGVDAKARRRVIVDLGLARALGYYTGAVFEVYDPALGVPLGGGGRYDDLLGRFGRGLPAVGFALNVERLHIALMGEEPR